MANLYGGWSSMPASGPLRASNCLTGTTGVGGSVKWNGLRNPWGAYTGETYRPYTEMMEAQQAGARTALGIGMGGAASIYAGAGSMYGGGGSILSEGSGMSGAYIGPGGYRNDDGWDGTVGRVHNGLAPDMTSTSGALPRISQSAGWPHSRAGPLNHASMTPSMAHSVIPNAYLQTPVAHSLGTPRIIPKLPQRLDVGHCEKCSCEGSPRRDRMSLSPGRGHGAGSMGGSIPTGGNGPYKKLGHSPGVGSPLRPINQVPIARHRSKSTASRSSGSRRCAQCAA